MNINIIQREDVIIVSQSIKKELTNSEIDYIVTWYPSWQKDDPSSNWSEVVESMIYNAIDLRKA